MTLDPKSLWQELLEKDDRTSPVEYPDMALITFDEFRDFLSRSAPSGQAPLEGVKPLEWVDRHEGHPREGDLIADSAVGQYVIRPRSSVGKFALWIAGAVYNAGVLFGTIEAAKDAAQADYEARIRSALLPASAEPVARTITKTDILREWFGGERYARDYEYLDASFGKQAEQVLAYIRSPASGAVEAAFQARVQPWMMACFGAEISRDKIERNHRFIEEALELVQANNCTRSEAHQLVDYVFGRPSGEIHQEIGGVMVTLAALCLAIDEDMDAAGETELARIWTKIDKIRAKQAAKPKHSPLPAAPTEAR